MFWPTCVASGRVLSRDRVGKGRLTERMLRKLKGSTFHTVRIMMDKPWTTTEWGGTAHISKREFKSQYTLCPLLDPPFSQVIPEISTRLALYIRPNL